MAIPVAKRRYTVAEYLELELASDVRHEFHDGEILAMAGGSVKHSRIASNTLIALGGALRGKPCQHVGSAVRTAALKNMWRVWQRLCHLQARIDDYMMLFLSDGNQAKQQTIREDTPKPAHEVG